MKNNINKNNSLILFIFILFSFFVYFKFLKKDISIKNNLFNKKKLIVGTNAEFPPFEFINNGELVGLDIDIINEVGRRLGLEIEFKNISFDILLIELIYGKIDLIASGMTKTKERERVVSFSKNYINEDNLCIITLKKNKINEILDLKGKSIVVNSGYAAEKYIESKKDIIKYLNLKKLDGVSEAMMDVLSEKSFAFISSELPLKKFFEKFGYDEFNILKLSEKEEVCFALSKKSLDLLNKINSILKDMESDGFMKNLKNKWNI